MIYYVCMYSCHLFLELRLPKRANSEIYNGASNIHTRNSSKTGDPTIFKYFQLTGIIGEDLDKLAYIAAIQFFLVHSVPKRTAGKIFEAYTVNILSLAVLEIVFVDLSWKLS